MKHAKKLILAAAVAAMTAATLLPTAPVKAAEYLEEPIIFGIDNHGVINDDNPGDFYKLSVPDCGILDLIMNVSGTDIEVDIFNDESGHGIVMDDPMTVTEKDGTRSFQIPVNKGTYTIQFITPTTIYGSAVSTYTFTCNYKLKTSEKIKVTTAADEKGKKSIHVIASKGQNCAGYQIRTRAAGDTKWAVKKVTTKKNLNCYIRNVEKGKTYEVMVRKYADDAYGSRYYSEWSSKSVVKL